MEIDTETYYCHVQDEKVIIQEAKYLEHGWFVHIEDEVISLKEIPYGGGKEIHLGTFGSIIEAVNAGKSLT